MAPKLPRSIKCETSQSLEYELEHTIRPNLSLPETEDSWDKIAFGLQYLQLLLSSLPASLHPDLVQSIKSPPPSSSKSSASSSNQTSLSRPITSALLSERSKLAGLATDLLSTLASTLPRAHFEPLLPLFIPPLLTATARSNKVFVARAKSTLLTIVNSTQSPLLLPYFRGAVTDPHNSSSKSLSARLAATELVARCLQVLNPPDVERSTARAEDVEAVIFATATDASAEVRQVSKKVFEAYKELLPGRLDSFVNPMTPTMKRYLAITSKEKPTSTLTSSTTSLSTSTRNNNNNILDPVMKKSTSTSTLTSSKSVKDLKRTAAAMAVDDVASRLERSEPKQHLQRTTTTTSATTMQPPPEPKKGPLRPNKPSHPSSSDDKLVASSSTRRPPLPHAQTSRPLSLHQLARPPPPPSQNHASDPLLTSSSSTSASHPTRTGGGARRPEAPAPAPAPSRPNSVLLLEDLRKKTSEELRKSTEERFAPVPGKGPRRVPKPQSMLDEEEEKEKKKAKAAIAAANAKAKAKADAKARDTASKDADANAKNVAGQTRGETKDRGLSRSAGDASTGTASSNARRREAVRAKAEEAVSAKVQIALGVSGGGVTHRRKDKTNGTSTGASGGGGGGGHVRSVSQPAVSSTSTTVSSSKEKERQKEKEKEKKRAEGEATAAADPSEKDSSEAKEAKKKSEAALETISKQEKKEKREKKKTDAELMPPPPPPSSASVSASAPPSAPQAPVSTAPTSSTSISTSTSPSNCTGTTTSTARPGLTAPTLAQMARMKEKKETKATRRSTKSPTKSKKQGVVKSATAAKVVVKVRPLTIRKGAGGMRRKSLVLGLKGLRLKGRRSGGGNAEAEAKTQEGEVTGEGEGEKTRPSSTCSSSEPKIDGIEIDDASAPTPIPCDNALSTHSPSASTDDEPDASPQPVPIPCFSSPVITPPPPDSPESSLSDTSSSNSSSTDAGNNSSSPSSNSYDHDLLQPHTPPRAFALPPGGVTAATPISALLFSIERGFVAPTPSPHFARMGGVREEDEDGYEDVDVDEVEVDEDIASGERLPRLNFNVAASEDDDLAEEAEALKEIDFALAGTEIEHGSSPSSHLSTSPPTSETTSCSLKMSSPPLCQKEDLVAYTPDGQTKSRSRSERSERRPPLGSVDTNCVL